MEQSLAVYRVFYEVAAAGNISRAAKKLNISQPAISKSLAKLEKNLDTRLFTRTSRGVQLTASGDVLYSHLQDAFEFIEKGEQELRMIKDSNYGHIKIGGSTTLCKYVLVPYLKEYIKEHPFTKIAIDNHATAETVKSVENGSIDIGTVVINKPKKGLKFIKLMDVEDTFVCTPEYLRYLHDLYGENVDVFKEANFMLLFKDNDTRRYIDEYFRNNGIEPLRKIEMTTMDLLIDFAKISVGIAGVEKEFVLEELKEGTLIEIPLNVKIPKRQAGFIYLESNTNEALKDFLESIR